MSAFAHPVPNTRPARRGLYYGWVSVALAALAMVGTLPGRTQGLGLITEPLLADLRMDRVSFAAINLWATLIGSLFCLPCGRLVDRFGSRLVLTVVLAALAAIVLGMSAASGAIVLGVAITLSRGFGQSALSVVSLTLVGKWFGVRLNYAMGVYALLVGIGFIAAFPSVGSAVISLGWRTAWSGVGWVLLLVLTPLAWLAVRNGPDQRAPEFDVDDAGGAPAAADLTLSQALRSTAFWLFALSSSMFGLVYSGISLFNQSILEQRGFGASVYHQVLVISTLLGLAANFGAGWLASRWPIQRLMGLGMAALSGALLWLPLVRTYTHVLIYGAAMGISGGIVTVVFFSVWGRVYGRQHLGKIQGCAQMLTVLASAVGPLLLAETLQRTGSYDAIFYGLAVIVVALGTGSWLVRLPSRKAPLAVLCVLMALGGCSKKVVTTQDQLDQKFQAMMNGVTLVGRSTRLHDDKIIGEEKYVIEGVSKLVGDTWLFRTRLQHDGTDIPVPVPVAIKWAGDTPVITLTDLSIPGMGTYTARVVLYRDQYAGTWSGKGKGGTEHGGQIFGKIVRNR